MGQRFRRVIAQLGGDRDPRVTVDHKGVVRVADDSCKFHLENSVELLSDRTDVKFESPYHRGSPSPWRYSRPANDSTTSHLVPELNSGRRFCCVNLRLRA